jgi:hypothetical protein
MQVLLTVLAIVVLARSIPNRFVRESSFRACRLIGWKRKLTRTSTPSEEHG